MERGQLDEAMLWLARAVELAPEEDGDVRHYARASFAGLEADAPALKAMWVPHHPGPVAAAAFGADGTTVLTGGEAADGRRARLGCGTRRPASRAPRHCPTKPGV